MGIDVGWGVGVCEIFIRSTAKNTNIGGKNSDIYSPGR